MLDSSKGHITLPNNTVITKFTTLETINRQSDIGNTFSVDYNNGYSSAQLKKVKSNDFFFYFDFNFKEGSLNTISFTILTREETSQTWDDWSEKNEKLKVNRQEKWLNSILGRKRDFNWGKVSNSFDPKSGSARIVIQLKN